MNRVAASLVLVAMSACRKQEDAVTRPEATTSAPSIDASVVASPAPSASVDPTTADSAQPLGMIGLLNAGGGGDPNAPTAPWGRDDSQADGGGKLWRDAGEAFRIGGLGLIGAGSSDGGAGGRVAPRIRQGQTTVNGRLPPEVIQRIVRQNFGRFRVCYENGLRADPKLAGTVATRFVIDTQGNVSSSARDASTTLTNASVVACINRAFTNLSFPQPEGGIVTVIFPLVLEPPET